MQKSRVALGMSLLLACSVVFSCTGSRGGARIVEKRETIKTYPFSEPDPVPILARTRMREAAGRLYPYYFFDGFSRTGVDKKWTVVRLENPYISVAVLPQVGGKVWGAMDKGAGREFLYTNHVLKFREIALRGPWVSGGIEFNFGIVGHAPSTATPVDYALQKSGDGSVSIVVGTMDLPSRTRWSVTITLSPARSYFETNGAWLNPTPFSQSYYYWSCAAIKAAEDLKYVFPGRFEIGHDYSVPLEPWPVDTEGRDLSWYKNNNFGGSKSYFTVGEYKDFFGAWYQKSDYGFGHWAAYDEMPGHKIWIWDESRAGEIWVDLLTDKDGQYTEPQAGRLLNQSDQESFKPGAADRWQELWFPYRGIGPMVKASSVGVLSAVASNEKLSLGFFALQPIDDDLIVDADGREVFREHVKLRPAEIYKNEVKPVAESARYIVKIGEKFVYRSGPAADALKRPFNFSPVDESTAGGLFQSGMRFEKSRSFDRALEKYAACLASDPRHLGALVRSAEIHARRGEYELSLGLARKALEEQMYDPEANYVYGTVARRLGDLADAKETLGWAARSMEFRSAAYLQLAEIAASEKAYDRARDNALRSLDCNKFNSAAYEVLAVAYRKSGRVEAAKSVLRDLLSIDPLDHFARFELYLLEPEKKNLERFRSMIRNELPHENYLEMALEYLRLGCEDDAVLLLKDAPAYPTVDYWLAYLLRDTSPAESRAYLRKASGRSPFLVFPFREEEIPLFEWARTAEPEDWKPKYYLGLVLWGKGRLAETLELFKQCDEADFAPFFLARAQLFQGQDPERALADYERALILDRKAWRSWHGLIDYYGKVGKSELALAAARQAVELFPQQVSIKVDLVKSTMAVGLFDEAAALLDTVEALPFEGASEIHGLFEETHIELAVKNIEKGDWAGAIGELERSTEYPEELGTGKPFDPDLRLQDYLKGLCSEKLGLKDQADDAFKSVFEYSLRHPEKGGTGAYFGALALRRFGELAKAEEMMEKSAQPSASVLAALRIF
jgi:tetratricopeptide (TPR) repeat protein